MIPTPPIYALQGPDWWYEQWGLGDWLATLFSQPVEVHAFVLGAFVGVAAASLTVTSHPRTALAMVLAVVLFTFGALETVFVCSAEFAACQHLRIKPWYFVGGFAAFHLLSIPVARRVVGRDDETGEPPVVPLLTVRSDSDSDRSAGTALAGLLLVVLVGLATYSFVSPRPVHPVTGLATLGGLVGSALGLAAFEWAQSGDGDGPTFRIAARRVLWRARDDSIFAVAAGTVLAFGYPRLFWELGELTGQPGFVLGTITWARNGLPSVTAYVFGLFLVFLAVTAVRLRRLEEDRLGGRRFAALVLTFVTYGACMFVLTGYATLLWFRVIPSASG